MSGRLSSYVPEDADWYLSGCVEANRVGRHSPLTINTLLIRADSPDEAHEKALRFGRRANATGKNGAGELVRTRFLGLAELNVIDEPLEDGSELTYRKRSAATLAAARRFVAPRSKLAVFRGRNPPGPSEPDVIQSGLRRGLESFVAGRAQQQVRTPHRSRVRRS